MILIVFSLKIFQNLNVEVYEPFERTKHLITNKNDWAYELAKKNVNDLKSCDCILAIFNGNPPDEGVMVELGIAIALNKEIFLFRGKRRRIAKN